MNQQFIVILLVFLMVFILTILAMYFLLPNKSRKRVNSLRIEKQSPYKTSEFFDKVVSVTDPFAKLSIPKEGWEDSALQRTFVNAGWREDYIPNVFFTVKTFFAVIFPVFAYFSMYSSFQASDDKLTLIVWLLLITTIGYYIPNVILSRSLKKRQLEIIENFPDSLDLLTVCVEAGLSFDQALGKVALEMKGKTPALANDLQLVLIEMRTGYSRERALRNLSLRTGVEEIDLLTTLIIQSERFGTSIGDSLRVQAENLRHKRKVKAEEMAAKLSLKLLFPLTICIFPVFFIVVMGPAVINVIRVIKPALSGNF